ncbi:hypothetical protein BABINDRAFT_159565 [Babjeviella inositovora NRRL Y-12698]|uniref:Cyclin-D1-binding protein 1-like N-terminal domain-containing protein n=1 Tax=Babjeviella inositovora NRRL Y-12698 TaxID=984486 RepID=A0A1E3R146_9ASCO|nr:uncharacterized protein BABINDRAFT_159565 [Babjeviella inositovora NRRL Y-12698]ODQ83107.1 hypothetical protein BABINDRAFT_159565 [Babjeviella inositovora NRRL Y-12698]
MSEEPFTEEQLRELLQTYKNGLTVWQTAISNPAAIAEIKAAQVPDPIAELVKLSKIMHALATKTGIVFKPGPVPVNAAYKQVREASEKIVLYVTLVAQLDAATYSDIFVKEAVHRVKQVLHSNEKLVVHLEGMDLAAAPSREVSAEEEAQDVRLITVGLIWAACDAVVELCEKGKKGLLNVKIKESSSMLVDAVQELEEWIENPDDFDDEDPFGLDLSDDEALVESDGSVSEEDLSELLAFAKTWVQKLKLIKLLFSSVHKSIPIESKITGEHINTIYKYVTEITGNIDELVVTAMMNRDVDECKKTSVEITNDAKSLVMFVRSLNSGNYQKTKWVDTWLLKFNE